MEEESGYKEGDEEEEVRKPPTAAHQQWKLEVDESESGGKIFEFSH